MESLGYIRLNRKFFQGTQWTQARTFSPAEAWIDLIQLARFEVEPADLLLPNGRQLTIERGEIHASLRFLASRWGWSKGKVDRFLKNSKTGQQTRHGETIITLCNFDVYNPIKDDDGTVKRTATGQRRDSDGTNNNKDNKDNKLLNNPNGLQIPPKFIKPTLDEVAAYCRERNNNIDPKKWIDYYTANGWKVGKNAMKDWKAAVRTWEGNEFNSKKHEDSRLHFSGKNYGESTI